MGKKIIPSFVEVRHKALFTQMNDGKSTVARIRLDSLGEGQPPE
jgi:hypothetical protein